MASHDVRVGMDGANQREVSGAACGTPKKPPIEVERWGDLPTSMAHQPTEPSCFECLDRIADTHALETHAQLVCQPPGGFAIFNGKGQSARQPWAQLGYSRTRVGNRPTG